MTGASEGLATVSQMVAPGGRGWTGGRAPGRHRAPPVRGVAVLAAALALSACGSALAAPGVTPRVAPSVPALARPLSGFGLTPPGTGAGAGTTFLPGIPRFGGTGTGGATRIRPSDPVLSTTATQPFYQVPSPLSPAPPGSIIRSETIPSDGQLPEGATAYRILYHSQSLTGADIAVSGIAVVPGGIPPARGFPIVSWAHGTAGLAVQCAPSIWGPGSIPLLGSLLRHRAIVVATDYEGLGTPGPQPYLIGQGEAEGVLDAARSARALVGASASNTVIIVGYSQGGQAALFAGQMAQTYAPELFVPGVAAVAPVTSLDEFVPATPQQRTAKGLFALMALYAWSATYGNLPLASLLTPLALQDRAAIVSSCGGAAATRVANIPAGQLFRPGWDRDPVLAARIADNEPGQVATAAPMLVVQGTADSVVPYATTTRFVADSLCGSQRDTVDYAAIEGAGHDSILTAATSALMDWITMRLANAPGTNSCARILTTTP
ncbi:MAG: alpha/beta fold hydrolase [Acidimicrobiales bacterium]|nr:alpha/beta fold hydrolase [Acidimicrobiales bacterium]